MSYADVERLSLASPRRRIVILDRALPSLADGLKPVQRRIVYAMSELGLSATAKYKKSARTVGDVIVTAVPYQVSGSKIQSGDGFPRLGDLMARNRAGKAVITVPDDAWVLLPVYVPDYEKSLLAAATDAGRLLVFPLSDLPQMPRGKGAKIINIPANRAAEEALASLLPVTEGVTLIVGAGPAGLAVGACLKRRGLSPVLLERGFDAILFATGFTPATLLPSDHPPGEGRHPDHPTLYFCGFLPDFQLIGRSARQIARALAEAGSA